MWVLLGIAVLVAGFVARLNPLAVILAAAVVTGTAAAIAPGVGVGELGAAALDTIAAFGKAFNDYRYISVIWLVLPLIGLLERYGLQERARILVGKVRSATTGRGMATLDPANPMLCASAAPSTTEETTTVAVPARAMLRSSRRRRHRP